MPASRTSGTQGTSLFDGDSDPWWRQWLPLLSLLAWGGILPRPPTLTWLLLVGAASGLPGRCPIQSQPCISTLLPSLLLLFSLQELPGCEGQRRVVWEKAHQAVPGPTLPDIYPEPPSSGPWRHSAGSWDTRKENQGAKPELSPNPTLALLGAPPLTYSVEDLGHLVV